LFIYLLVNFNYQKAAILRRQHLSTPKAEIAAL